jgi:hypothetical protein
MKRVLFAFFVAVFVVFMTACTTSQHIGKSVSYDHPQVCTWNTLPSACRVMTEHFDFEFTVEQISDNEFRIDGQAVNLGSERVESIASGTFDFLLIKEQMIIDAVSVAPTGSLEFKIPLKKRFQSEEDFDALLVTYQLKVLSR